MKITVMYADRTLGLVNDDELDHLLQLKIITGFYRASGWAYTGRDELRRKRTGYEGSWRDRKSNRLLLAA